MYRMRWLVHPPTGLAQYIERLGAAVGLQDAITFFAQDAVGQAAGHPLIIHHEDGGRDAGKGDGQSGPRRQREPTSQSKLVSTLA